MLYINVLLRVNDAAQVDHVRELIARHGELSRGEPGCARFDVYQSQNDPQRFILTEWWESQAAIDEHRKAEGYTTIYVPQILPLVTREPHPSNLVR